MDQINPSAMSSQQDQQLGSRQQNISREQQQVTKNLFMEPQHNDRELAEMEERKQFERYNNANDIQKGSVDDQEPK